VGEPAGAGDLDPLLRTGMRLVLRHGFFAHNRCWSCWIAVSLDVAVVLIYVLSGVSRTANNTGPTLDPVGTPHITERHHIPAGSSPTERRPAT
jgi:hypothetical protein